MCTELLVTLTCLYMAFVYSVFYMYVDGFHAPARTHDLFAR